jgi:hypothetical protein
MLRASRSIAGSDNPGKFTTASGAVQSGNYLLYWMANQALCRLDPSGAKGLDGMRLDLCSFLDFIVRSEGSTKTGSRGLGRQDILGDGRGTMRRLFRTDTL